MGQSVHCALQHAELWVSVVVTGKALPGSPPCRARMFEGLIEFLGSSLEFAKLIVELALLNCSLTVDNVALDLWHSLESADYEHWDPAKAMRNIQTRQGARAGSGKYGRAA